MNAPIKKFSLDELKQVTAQCGLPSFRANQIASWIYGKGVSSYDEMTNIPRAVRDQFSKEYPLYTADIVTSLTSKDQSRKYLIHYEDGATVETVALPNDDGRLTVCVSSQSGCAMGCDFCATGKGGFNRNLLPGEIVDQVLIVQSDFDKRVTNVVVMGQGEPFSNYDNTLAALRILNHKNLLSIGARHITLSTCGLIQGITRLSSEPEQFTLAVSLHSAIQNTRDAIMPGVHSQSLGELRSALVSYTEKTNRRFSFEYALMNGVNDTEEHMIALKRYARDLLCHVNLIPLNKIEDSAYQPSRMATVKKWQNELERAGISCTVRQSRGSDIAGACGQLANTHR